MEPATILKIGTETVSLVAALNKLIKENHDKQPGSALSLLLARLRVDALRISSEVEMKFRILGEKLNDLGLDPTRTLESQLRELQWYNWVSRARLKGFHEELYGASRQLSSFVDDAAALMLCEGTIGKTEMFAEAYNKKRELDAIVFDPQRSLGGILEKLLEFASKVNLDLQSA